MFFNSQVDGIKELGNKTNKDEEMDEDIEDSCFYVLILKQQDMKNKDTSAASSLGFSFH